MDLSVITVSNNHRQYLERCLDTLREHGGNFATEIFVVDNASVDGTVDFVRSCYPEVALVCGEKKRGFSANNNLAIRRSAGRYILLLNPDTEVTPNALDALVEFMDKHPLVGVCGPQLRFPDGSIQLSCRAFPTWQSVLVRRTPLRLFMQDSAFNRKHLLADIDHSRTQEVDWLLGAAMMVRRETIEGVGLLDERYFLYVEDIDYCWRASKQGWKVYYVPDAVIIHHHLAVSDKNFFDVHTYYHFSSMLRFFLKFKLRF